MFYWDENLRKEKKKTLDVVGNERYVREVTYLSDLKMCGSQKTSFHSFELPVYSVDIDSVHRPSSHHDL